MQNKFEFIDSLRTFVKSLNVISECDKDKAVFTSSNFFYSEGLNKLLVESVLKSDPTLNRLFLENFQKNIFYISICFIWFLWFKIIASQTFY